MILSNSESLSMKVPTFLYHELEGAKLFEIAPGEEFPAGWRDAPHENAPIDVSPENKLAAVRAELEAAKAEIVALNDVIAGGRAENKAQAATIAELEASLAGVAAANRPARRKAAG